MCLYANYSAMKYTETSQKYDQLTFTYNTDKYYACLANAVKTSMKDFLRWTTPHCSK